MSIKETGRVIGQAQIHLGLTVAGKEIDLLLPAEVVLVPAGSPRADGRPREHDGIYIRPTVSLAQASGGDLAAPGLMLQLIRTGPLYQAVRQGQGQAPKPTAPKTRGQARAQAHEPTFVDATVAGQGPDPKLVQALATAIAAALAQNQNK
jgi:hypothetical protein